MNTVFKFTFLLILNALSIFAKSQTGKLEEFILLTKNNSFSKAIELSKAIDKNNQKNYTYQFHKGELYSKISQSDSLPQINNIALATAFSAYLSAYFCPNAKKNEVVERINSNKTTVRKFAANRFNSKDYQLAFSSFENLVKANELPEINQFDTAIVYNAAISAEKCKKMQEALNYYNSLIAKGYENPKIQLKRAFLFRAVKDTSAALKVLRSGIKKYTAYYNEFLLEFINYFINSNRPHLAIPYLQKATDIDPDNHLFYFTMATLYDDTGRQQQAITNYQKALDVQPEYFDALFNLGTLYYNNAAKIIETEGSETPEAKAKINKQLKLAQPYLEKAQAIDKKRTDLNEMLENIHQNVE